jgi:ATP adenylyltransferase
MSDETLRQDGVGRPDDLDRLWTPHRMAYIRGENKPSDASSGECPFCRIPRLTDEEGLVLRRGTLAYAVLNLYPYAPGHLMVCPYRHLADYTETTHEEAAEIADLTREAMRVVRSVSAAAGFNIGMNQGHIAGAGIAAHLHQHVVPRWPGDQNFMPIIGRTKTLPELLGDTRRLFAEAWDALAPASSPTRPGAGAPPPGPGTPGCRD